LIEEELDQSRPMTTRINENEDDQHLFMQYKNLPTPKYDDNKHMSVEAGLEKQSKEEMDNVEDVCNDIMDEQYSMIVKNIEEDDGVYAFASPIQTPTNNYNKHDETHLEEEDVMTVIEND
jgi:hypothetical protein